MSEENSEVEDNSITLYLDENEERLKKFGTIDELKEWVLGEQTFWNWVPKNNTHGSTSIIKQHIDSIFNNSLSNINTAIQHRSNPSNYESHLTNGINRLNTAYKSRKMFVSDDPVATFIISLKEKHISIGAHSFAYFANLENIPFNHLYAVEGMIETKIYLKGISNDGVDQYNDNFNDLITRTKTHLEEYTQEENRLRDEFKNITDATDLLMTTHESTHKQKMEEHGASYDEFIKKSEERLENVNNAYNEHMALKAPVKYWSDKVTSAYIQATVVFVVLLLSLYFGGEFLLEKGQAVLALKVSEFHYGKASYFLIIALIVFWMIRIIVLILMSRLHLATEASEKAVMTQAYLSLLEEGKVDEDERELVLKNVFRPSGSGLIKDDHGHPALEVISKIMNKS